MRATDEESCRGRFPTPVTLDLPTKRYTFAGNAALSLEAYPLAVRPGIAAECGCPSVCLKALVQADFHVDVHLGIEARAFRQLSAISWVAARLRLSCLRSIAFGRVKYYRKTGPVSPQWPTSRRVCPSQAG
ncbi:hypothetical protein V8C35DRAFT_157465 [Trichoderma chlorosporum]